MTLINAKETAKFLGVSLRTIRLLIKQNKIPYVRISQHSIRFDQDDLVKWLESRKIYPVEIRNKFSKNNEWIQKGLKRHNLTKSE